MDLQLLTELQKMNIDTEGTLQRFAGNAALYEKFLLQYPGDDNFDKIGAAMSAENWETMLNAAHTLKGLTGNLGLTRLYRASSETVRFLREKNYDAAKDSYLELQAANEEICGLLNRFTEERK